MIEIMMTTLWEWLVNDEIDFFPAGTIAENPHLKPQTRR